jgi:hypothetical protein
MRMNVLNTIITLLAMCLLGCATRPSASIGTPNLETPLITRGVTTERELVARLGKAQGRGLDAKGRTLLTWNRIDAASTSKAYIPVVGAFLPGSVNVQKRQLAVSLDSSGRVSDYKITSEAHKANVFGTTD